MQIANQDNQYSISFPSLQHLQAFAATLKTGPIKIDINELTIICICSDEDVSRAVFDFKAFSCKRIISLK